MNLRSFEQFDAANNVEGRESAELAPDFIETFSDAEDRRYLEFLFNTVEKENKEEIRERMEELFAKEIAPQKINDLFVFPDKKIESRTFICSGYRSHGIEIACILFTDQRGKREICGVINFSFYRDEDNNLSYVDGRDLKEQKTGLGLDIECRLEKFCRDNGISAIYTRASSSSDKKFVGAYVHALYGYEFEWPGEFSDLGLKLNEYLLNKGIKIDAEIGSLQRPIDFATLKGTDRGGRVVEVGKEFLTTSDLTWEGRRDLALDSPGTQDFIKYLKEKGREDLIEKYF
jgi:ribosomal protein L23